jgi:Flp pilus assembly pilin Flp
MCHTIHRIIRRTEGQTQAEYAVVLTVVAASCAFLFSDLATSTSSIVSAVVALIS